MTRQVNRLTARRVATEQKVGYHADGGGLYLQVSKFGSKNWVFRFTMNGKAREMGLGALHTVSLAEARTDAEQCRKMVRDGIDPIEHRKRQRSQQLIEDARRMTFKACAEAYIKAHEAGWRNSKHAGQWQRTLETYAYPIFKEIPVDAIDVGMVMKVLEPIWSTKTETASRVRGRIENILDWAATRGYRAGENPARWKGHLDKLLPSRSRIRKVKHHAALPYDQIAAFMVELRGLDSVAAQGLAFLILTATRTSETIGATWAEFDLEKKVWTIPAERTKTHAEHRVPISDSALEILNERKGKSPLYVFPGQRKGRPLSNMAFLQLLKRMKRDELTAHGFRSTFRDWAAERTAYPNEVAEMALGHTISNLVEAAYRRGDLFEKRSRLMADWATYCASEPEGNSSGNVVPLNAKGA